MNEDKYLQVDPDFYEVIDAVMKTGTSFKVFYFDPNNTVQDARGDKMSRSADQDGEFVVVEDDRIRLDRIITLNGKVGPAYDQYDAYANACLSCQAGYDD